MYIAASIEWVAIGVGAASLASALASVVERWTRREVARRVTLTLREGDKEIKLDLDDPEQAAEFLSTLREPGVYSVHVARASHKAAADSGESDEPT